MRKARKDRLHRRKLVEKFGDEKEAEDKTESVTSSVEAFTAMDYSIGEVEYGMFLIGNSFI